MNNQVETVQVCITAGTLTSAAIFTDDTNHMNTATQFYESSHRM